MTDPAQPFVEDLDLRGHTMPSGPRTSFSFPRASLVPPMQPDAASRAVFALRSQFRVICEALRVHGVLQAHVTMPGVVALAPAPSPVDVTLAFYRAQQAEAAGGSTRRLHYGRETDDLDGHVRRFVSELMTQPASDRVTRFEIDPRVPLLRAFDGSGVEIALPDYADTDAWTVR